ncbi:MAG: hypothetical protein GX786_03130, partial [Clostridiales bacterium]|nr:hypothetical protein [Clostridiales bacterium]
MNKKTASFSKFHLAPGKISFLCTLKNMDTLVKEDRIYFLLSESIVPHHDLIAYACATLCYGYDVIHFELPISTTAQQNIAQFVGGTVHAPQLTKGPFLEESFAQRSETALHFSGGFDSLAALSLLPEKPLLVSVDFEGPFTRESGSFKSFSPYQVKTNLRRLGYHEAHWTFMGIGVLLYAQHLRIGYEVFGTILGDSFYSFTPFPSPSEKTDVLPFSYAGIEDLLVVTGLSEVITLRLVHYYYPQHLTSTFYSVADHASVKQYRKWLILHALYTQILKLENPIKESSLSPPSQKLFFGAHLPSDFLSFYFIKTLGEAYALKIHSAFPFEVQYLSKILSLHFYNRIHPAYLEA